MTYGEIGGILALFVGIGWGAGMTVYVLGAARGGLIDAVTAGAGE